jgi:hypothetical protein
MKFFKYILFSVLISFTAFTLKASDYSQSVAERSMEFNLFPNPIDNGDVLNIIAEKEIERVEVLNIVGELMRIENINETNRAKLNIDELKEGIYLVKIIFVDKTSSTKRLWVK